MLKKICNTLVVIILIFLVIVAGALLGPKLFGYESYAVLSGSMEPTFHVGSTVLVKDVPIDQVQEGDPITFRVGSDGTIVTHRVVEIDKENKAFTTKGDANDANDLDAVPFSQYIGKAENSIPLVGFVSIYVQTLPGILAIAAIVLILLILSFLPDFLGKGKQEHKEDNEEIKHAQEELEE
ncbi:signal peptidase I [Candidatus Soleaferrea massiliensis]|uniref:signal peptidase I n=1 Tax=Candidatus Soleaferrea massiliensis TaxID=1470354 RepID=UPI000694F963|nr:signal peptidase I [Candidatus Soleaferrea massiliensis]